MFIASVILLFFDKEEILELSTFGNVVKPAVILLSVVTGALSFTSIVAFFIDLINQGRRRTLLQQRRVIKRAEQEKKWNEEKQKVLERVPHLSKAELNHLADCLRGNSQSFTAYAHSPAVSTLIAKGLIYTPRGVHNRDYYPFVVNDFVWQYLLENQLQIIAHDEENKLAEEEKKQNIRHR